MKSGTIKFYVKGKGYGFIVVDDDEKDVFFHHTGLVNGDDVAEDDKVTFDVEEGRKGAQAVNILVV